jgi:hypothetical protein
VSTTDESEHKDGVTSGDDQKILELEMLFGERYAILAGGTGSYAVCHLIAQ